MANQDERGHRSDRGGEPEVLMYEGDRHAALPDGRGDALDGSEPDVARRRKAATLYLQKPGLGNLARAAASAAGVPVRAPARQGVPPWLRSAS